VRERKREREEEEADTGFKYKLVVPQQMARLVDTRHKMTRLSVTPSAVARFNRLSPCGVKSVIVHALAPWHNSFISRARRTGVTKKGQI
jgi:hypothetical protein